METVFGLLVGCGLLGVLVYFVRQDGKKAERLAALKQEIKEISRAQDITDAVGRMSAHCVRDKLKQTK